MINAWDLNFTTPTTSLNGQNYTNNNYIEINVTSYALNTSNITLIFFNNSLIINQTEVNSDNIFVNYTNLSEGIYYFNSTGYDNESNLSSTNTLNVTIDFTNPLINITVNATENYTNYAILSINITDLNLANSTIYIYDNNSILEYNFTNYSSTYIVNISNLNNGIHYYNITALDLAGNRNSTITYNITFDKVNPAIEYSDGTDQNGLHTNRSYVVINITGSDTTTINITLNIYRYNSTNDSSSLINYTYTNQNNLYLIYNLTSDARYYYNATIIDYVGNQNNTQTRNITIDATLPLITYSTNTDSDGSFVNRSFIQINITSNDTNVINTTIRIYHINGTLANYSTSTNNNTFLNYSDVSNGTYLYNATMYDLAGNQNTTQTRNITIDTIIPNVTVNSPDNNYTFNSSNATLNITVVDTYISNTTILIYNSTNNSINQTILEDGIYISGSNLIFSINLTNGTYYYNITSVDFAGNTNITSRNFTVAIASSQGGSQGGGGGGSGGGGGGSGGSSGSSSSSSSASTESTTDDVTYSKTWLYLIKGERYVEISKEGIPISKVSMNINTSDNKIIQNLKITSSNENVVDQSEDINANIYKYLIINTGLESRYLENVKVTFKVEKYWLETNNITKENLTIYSYEDNNWNIVPNEFYEILNYESNDNNSNSSEYNESYNYYTMNIDGIELLALGTPILPKIIEPQKEEIKDNVGEVTIEIDNSQIETETTASENTNPKTSIFKLISNSLSKYASGSKDTISTLPSNTKVLLAILFSTISTLLIITVAGTIIYRKLISSKENSTWYKKYAKQKTITPYEREPNIEAKLSINNTNNNLNNQNSEINKTDKTNSQNKITQPKKIVQDKPLTSQDLAINKIKDLIDQSERLLGSGKIEEAKKMYTDAKTLYFNSGIDYEYKAKVYDRIMKLHTKIYK